MSCSQVTEKQVPVCLRSQDRGSLRSQPSCTTLRGCICFHLPRATGSLQGYFKPPRKTNALYLCFLTKLFPEEDSEWPSG